MESQRPSSGAVTPERPGAAYGRPTPEKREQPAAVLDSLGSAPEDFVGVGPSSVRWTIDDLEASSDEECEARRMAGTPAQLRAKIRKLLQSTDIKVTEFQRILGVNSNTYGRFMTQKYKNPWAAMENSTYDAAARFFLREKKLGQDAMGKVRSTAAKGRKPALPDVSAISTDGLTYLTPGETRREIQALLKAHAGSAASLARTANVPYQGFNLFLKAAGEWGGKDNQAYRPAAALVEKFRIVMGKPKSRKRKGIELEVASRGVRDDGQPFLGVDPDGATLCPPGTRPCIVKDVLGRNVIEYRRG